MSLVPWSSEEEEDSEEEDEGKDTFNGESRSPAEAQQKALFKAKSADSQKGGVMMFNPMGAVGDSDDDDDDDDGGGRGTSSGGGEGGGEVSQPLALERLRDELPPVRARRPS